MEFNKAYNRGEFVNFLQNNFLPEDFAPAVENVSFATQTQYAKVATRLGTCRSLDLVVYEIQHSSVNDARVGLSKEAFRLLADEMEDRALVVFVSQDKAATYRFSLIEVTLSLIEGSSHVGRTYSNPRRYSYVLGEGIPYYTPNKYLNQMGRVINEDDLRDRFSVEKLTKEFYNELSDWYAWAIQEIRFPNKLYDKSDDTKFNHESAIRMITRLIFVWFLKQRHLVPNEFFDQEYLSNELLNDFHPNMTYGLFANKSIESRYYKAILQNLFFAMLNSPITDDSGTKSMRRFSKMDYNDHGNTKLMRHKWMFKNPALFLELANKTVPFLNGGLFDCLDEEQNNIYYDGFSDREIVGKSLCVPDYLFFGEVNDIDLSEWSMDVAKKKTKVYGIIDILKKYNFTVEENTPFDKEVSLDPELLGKVFENLLAAFNPETQQTARKQTGSFYTPREIVQYMVDESIIAHLRQHVGEDLEPQYRKLLQYTDEPIDLTADQKSKIMKSLYDCKILDPACGSGAFPMGVLQQMVHILGRIDPDNAQWKDMMLNNAINETSQAYRNSTSEERAEIVADIERSFNESLNRPDYARKLYLIENCIYGIDIQPIAIQISKLRFFISLVIDQKINNDPKDNFGIRPLPNLEAKFVAANSLIGLKMAETTLFDLPEIQQKQEKLKEARHKIFSAQTYSTKKKYRGQVAQLRDEIANLLKENDIVGDEEARQLSSWDMFDQNASSPFFDAEWMFDVRDGFDIVIGNPPYIQLQNNGGELGKLYQDCGFQTFASTGDIYCLFYERGHQLLKEGGHLCYITSNKWMRAGYGEKTRAFFANHTNPELLIDFGGVKIFESATVDTNILLFSKAKNQHKTRSIVIGKTQSDSINNLSDFVQQNASICEFKANESWVVLSDIERSIKQKIEAVGTPLKDWDIQIYRGVLTGCNEAFIIDGAKRDEILNNCRTSEERQRTEELIRPILRGRDIKRYGYNWANLWLINTHNGVKGRIPRIDIADYPAVKAHLDQYWDKIRDRADQGDTPYNLRNCAYLEDFFRPKIVYGQFQDSAEYSFAESGIFLSSNEYLLITRTYSEKCLLSFLNSKVSEWLLGQITGNLGGNAKIGQKSNFLKLAVITLPAQRQRQYEDIVDEILNLKAKCKDTSLLEKQIDMMIYNDYGLSIDEIQLIESQ